MKVYNDPERTSELNFVFINSKNRNDAKKEKGKGKKENTFTAFVNPYTSEIISHYEKKNSFFSKVQYLHRWLLVEDVGKLIVGICVSIFLFILITGIILWWPKNKELLKQRLKIKFSAQWKRINHDLHMVIGFYASVFLLVCALTGLIMNFNWMNDGIFWLTGTLNKKMEAPNSFIRKNENRISCNEIFLLVRKENPKAEYYVINQPKDSLQSYSVMVLRENALHEKATDIFYYDQYSGKLLGKQLYEEKNIGQKIRAAVFPIHSGAIGGIGGKIVILLACIAGFTFPITGVINWINRIRKKK